MMMTEQDSSMHSHVALDGSEHYVLPGAQVLASAHPSDPMEVTLILRRKESLPELTDRPQVAMTRQELADKHGASTKDIEEVCAVFDELGLSVLEADVGARTIRLTGSVTAMEKAFHVKLLEYTHDSGNYRGHVGPIHVPRQIANIVVCVVGLDNRSIVKRRSQPTRDAPQARLPSTNNVGYTSGQLAQHYNFPSGDGSGQTVGILQFGGGYFSEDLETYCNLAGVNVPTVQVISVDGAPTSTKDGLAAEVMLDVEIVAGVCPEATIVLYFTKFTESGWLAALNYVANDDANDPGVLSVSWAYTELQGIWTNCVMDAVNDKLKELAHLGITVCAAAGDNGSSDGMNDGLAHVPFPSSSPYVLSVGGTTVVDLQPDAADIVWKEGSGVQASDGGSTGGGVSAAFPRPSWQSGINIESVNPTTFVGRCIPNVAANADWDASPYLLVLHGRSRPSGGTSAAAPLWASLITLINAQRGHGNRVGYLTPMLYQEQNGSTVGAQGCVDVPPPGNNDTAEVGGYNARTGYDAVSGWGTPNGQMLLKVLNQAFPS